MEWEVSALITMELNVYRFLSTEQLACLERAPVRENVTVLFRETPAEDWRPSPEEVSVLFTDDPGVIARLAGALPAFAHLVYLGRAEDAADHLNHLSEIWPAGEPDAIRAARFTKLADRIRDQYDSKLYQGLLESTLATAPDLVWFKKLDGIHTLVNQVFSDTVHKTREDIHGKDHYYIWDAPRPQAGDEANDCSASEEQVIQAEKTLTFEEPVSTREGMKQLTTYKTPIYDPLGRIFGTVGFGHDVTHFSNMGIQLSILVESIPFPMILMSADGKAMRVNSSFQEMTGLGENDWQDFDFRDWKHRHLTPLAPARENPEKHSVSREYALEQGKEERICDVTEVAIHDYFGNISGYFCVFHDITFQRAYEREILKAANTDTLTGLYSRRYFFEFLHHVKGRPLTLLYLDIDHLKETNDRFGHGAGDEALKACAGAFKRHFSEGVVARLGGDEFAIILEGKTDPAQMNRQIQELEEDVNRIAAGKGQPFSVSVGFISSDGGITDVDAFLLEGDQRMYEVKKRHHRLRR